MKAIAYCGLACCVCSENKDCAGCQDGGCESHGHCKNYTCCKEKNLNGCWECPEFPCAGGMLDRLRIRAFARFAGRYGVDELETCLLRNKEKGIVYHYEGQLVGDYDKCRTEEEVIKMIKTGSCPAEPDLDEPRKHWESVTDDFYSRFCGTRLSDLPQGVRFVCSEARNEELRGFGCRYTMYVLVRDHGCVISYAPQYAEYFNTWKNSSADEILPALNASYGMTKMQLMIFRKESVREYGGARILRAADYPAFETFFCRTHPAANPAGWLREYFEEKTAKEYMTGYFVNGALVSVCDAPDMPYMEGIIQHTGIMTVKEERRKGYAKCTAALAVHHLLEVGICPQWECAAENAASIALAQSIGFETYGMAYILKE